MQINGLGNGGYYPNGNPHNDGAKRVLSAHPAQSAARKATSPQPNKNPTQPSKRLPPANRERVPRSAREQVYIEHIHMKQKPEPEAIRMGEPSPHARRAISAYTNQSRAEQQENISRIMGIDLYA